MRTIETPLSATSLVPWFRDYRFESPLTGSFVSISRPSSRVSTASTASTIPITPPVPRTQEVYDVRPGTTRWNITRWPSGAVTFIEEYAARRTRPDNVTAIPRGGVHQDRQQGDSPDTVFNSPADSYAVMEAQRRLQASSTSPARLGHPLPSLLQDAVHLNWSHLDPDVEAFLDEISPYHSGLWTVCRAADIRTMLAEFRNLYAAFEGNIPFIHAMSTQELIERYNGTYPLPSSPTRKDVLDAMSVDQNRLASGGIDPYQTKRFHRWPAQASFEDRSEVESKPVEYRFTWLPNQIVFFSVGEVGSPLRYVFNNIDIRMNSSVYDAAPEFIKRGLLLYVLSPVEFTMMTAHSTLAFLPSRAHLSHAYYFTPNARDVAVDPTVLYPHAL